MGFSDTLYNFVVNNHSDWSLWSAEINGQVDEMSPRDRVLARISQRMATAFETGALLDGVLLLRQLVRAGIVKRISEAWWHEIHEIAERSGVLGLPDAAQVELSARPCELGWLDHEGSIDELVLRNATPGALGDGMLNAMRSSWTEYRSEAQKAAVDAWMFAPPGSTTLITLPTGSGKSLCTILPAWFDSRGGRVASGTTLVVVPTVALAMDQTSQARTFFRGTLQPECRTGADNARARMEIRDRLRNGDLPLLFTSPESLLSKGLYDTCLEAADDGLIARFVIDEAHLVESWGAGFRPEFQFLSTFRRRLFDRSSGKLRTLLLSATISERSREVLEQLFCDEGQLLSVQANRLRPEIAYWFNFAPREAVRTSRVLEALRFLPRPLILYVTQPAQAREWVSRLRAEGYHRVAAFTGETQADERERLLHAWMNDQIDIMIGTSAFGLGVDKSDVRAVVHATLPENMDRLYQEVGRSGRDGFGATALLVACPEDIGLAYSLGPKRITVEKAWPRWISMLTTPNEVQMGDQRLLDRDALPDGNIRGATDLDRDWNDHILLLLQRAGAIEVLDMVNDISSPQAPTARLLVRIHDAQILSDSDRFEAVFERARSDELTEKPTGDLISIVHAFSNKSPQECLGQRLSELYQDVQIACAGCPHCRATGASAHGGERLDYRVEYASSLAAQVAAVEPLASPMSARLGAWRSLIVTWSGPRNGPSYHPILDGLPDLLSFGFQQFVIPDSWFQDRAGLSDFVRDLARQDNEYVVYPHRVVPVSWAVSGNRLPLLPLHTVLIYPPDDKNADKLHRAWAVARALGRNMPGCIHIAHEATLLPSAGKALTAHVDGLAEPLEYFLDWLRAAQKTVN